MIIRLLFMTVLFLYGTSLFSQTTEHIVRRGETLTTIAKKYGVSEGELKKANKGGKTFYVGQKLKIPKPVARLAQNTGKTTQSRLAPSGSGGTSVPSKKANTPVGKPQMTGTQMSLLAEAEQFEQRGKFGKAIGIYDKILNGSAGNQAVVYYKRGMAKYNNGNYKSSIKDFNAAIRQPTCTKEISQACKNMLPQAEQKRQEKRAENAALLGELFSGMAVGMSASTTTTATAYRPSGISVYQSEAPVVSEPQPMMQTCPICRGTRVCNRCHGQGKTLASVGAKGQPYYQNCRLCNVSGMCLYCQGTGVKAVQAGSGSEGGDNSSPNSGSNRRISCAICHGDGKCSSCAGRGEKRLKDGTLIDCSTCSGRGRCRICHGKGFTRSR